jgi:hypothetical protein
MPISEQPAIDLRDTRLALGVALNLIERLVVMGGFPLPAVDSMLKDVSLARSVLSDETERDV